jgi:hypothetical protein
MPTVAGDAAGRATTGTPQIMNLMWRGSPIHLRTADFPELGDLCHEDYGSRSLQPLVTAAARTVSERSPR